MQFRAYLVLLTFCAMLITSTVCKSVTSTNVAGPDDVPTTEKPPKDDLAIEVPENDKLDVDAPENDKVEDPSFKGDKAALSACNTRVAFMASVSSRRFSNNRLVLYKSRSVVYDNIILNTGRNYNSRNGVFTCTIAGDYTFSSHAMNSDRYAVSLTMLVNRYRTRSYLAVASLYGGYNNRYIADSCSATIHLNRGDRVLMAATQTSTVHDEPSHRNSNTFMGHLVRADGC